MVNTACIHEIKAPKNSTALVSFGSKVGFFSKPKIGCGNSPQTLSLAFAVGFSGVLQLKNTKVGLSGSQEMRMSAFEKCLVWHRQTLASQGMIHTYVSENEEQPGGFAGRVLKD